MFIAVKLVIYIIAAHLLYTHGFDPTKKLTEFLTLMSCVLLMDVTSYSSAKYSIAQELNKKDERD